MRVLYWVELFPPHYGGVERLGDELTARLAGAGHNVLVITSHSDKNAPDTEIRRGVRVMRLPMRRAVNVVDIAQLAQLRSRIAAIKREFDAEIIHALAYSTIFFHLITAKADHAPWVAEFPDLPAAFSDDSLRERVFRAAAWVTSVSRTRLEQLRRVNPAITPRSSVILNAMPAPTISPAPAPAGPPVLACLGRIVFEKGFDVAIRAMPGIRARHPEARLIVAGEGTELNALRRVAEECGVADAVEFPGPVDSAHGLFNRATLVIMPSRHEEGFGLVALEAAQMARPVVATPSGGLVEVVLHEKTGLIVPKDDPAATAAAVCRLLDNPEWAAELGRAARSRAADEFSMDRYVREYEELYRRLIAERR